jgi:hypothetical protein
LNRQKQGSEIETSNEIPVSSHSQVQKQTRTTTHHYNTACKLQGHQNNNPSLQYCMQVATAPEYSRNEKTSKQAASKEGREKALPVSCRQW